MMRAGSSQRRRPCLKNRVTLFRLSQVGLAQTTRRDAPSAYATLQKVKTLCLTLDIIEQ